MSVGKFIKKVTGIRQDLKAYGMLTEIFVYQQYYTLFKGLKPHTTVIDIGAFMGDTCIYFAMSPNVERVLGFEPIPATWRKGRELLDNTSPEIKSKIEYSNAAVRDKSGKLRLSQRYIGSGSTKIDDAKGEDVNISVLTFNQIIKNRRNVALKVDCEGDEWLVLKDADLSKVYAIMLEYHSDDLRRLIQNKLKMEGFKYRLEGDSLLYAAR